MIVSVLQHQRIFYQRPMVAFNGTAEGMVNRRLNYDGISFFCKCLQCYGDGKNDTGSGNQPFLFQFPVKTSLIQEATEAK